MDSLKRNADIERKQVTVFSFDVLIVKELSKSYHENLQSKKIMVLPINDYETETENSRKPKNNKPPYFFILLVVLLLVFIAALIWIFS